MVNFDKFLGLTFVLNFHSFIFLTCEEIVRIFLDVKNWRQIVTNAKNRYQILILWEIGINSSHVKNWYQILISVMKW